MNFQKKPIVIQAVQYTGENALEIQTFGAKPEPTEHWGGACNEPGCKNNWNLIIPTLEGRHIAQPGDWIIRGIKGEYYPCKPDIFAATYDAVEQEATA